MYLADSEDEELVIVFKKQNRVSFNESKNKVYYIRSDTYFAVEKPKPPSESVLVHLNNCFELF